MRTQEVLFNVTGQSFFYDPPEGRPDVSPTPTLTVRLNTSGDQTAQIEVASSGAVSIDSVNTTIATADVAAGSQSVTLASATGVSRGRRYILTNAGGDREVVEVMTVAGSTVGLRRPTINAFAIGSTFVGSRLSVNVDPTWVATQGKISDILATTWRTTKESNHWWGAGYAGYRLTWSYSFGGAPTIGVSFADLVRYNAKSLVTPADVDTTFPGWIDRLPTDHVEDQGAALIVEAFHAVRMDAMGDDQVVRRIRNTEVLRELTIYRANVVLARAQVMAGAPASILDEARKEYAQRYDQLFREPKFQVDQIGDGSAAAARRAPVLRR